MGSYSLYYSHARTWLLHFGRLVRHSEELPALLASFFKTACTYISASSKHNKNNARIKNNDEWSNSGDNSARSRRVRRERENDGDEEEQKRERRDDYSSSSFEKKQKSSFRFEEYGEDHYRGNVHGKWLDGE